MNCDVARSHLIEFLQGSLPQELTELVQAHLRGCAACHQEEEELRHVLHLLSQTRAPEVEVDVAKIYRDAGERDKRQLRRWRRAALALGGMAAALLIAIVGFAFEVRWEGHQLVLRWGNPPHRPETVREQQDLPPQAPTVPADNDPGERLQVLSALVQALADDSQFQEARHRQQLQLLSARMESLQREHAQWKSDMENNFNALYQLHLVTKKGDLP